MLLLRGDAAMNHESLLRRGERLFMSEIFGVSPTKTYVLSEPMMVQIGVRNLSSERSDIGICKECRYKSLLIFFLPWQCVIEFGIGWFYWRIRKENLGNYPAESHSVVCMGFALVHIRIDWM